MSNFGFIFCTRPYGNKFDLIHASDMRWLVQFEFIGFSTSVHGVMNQPCHKETQNCPKGKLSLKNCIATDRDCIHCR